MNRSKLTKQLWQNPDYRKKQLEHHKGMLGKKHSEKAKNKMSEGHKKQWSNPIIRQKMLEALKEVNLKRYYPKEYKKKPIYQFDLNGNLLNKYKNRQEASQRIGISIAKISSNIACLFSSNHNFIWSWVDNSNEIALRIKLFKRIVKNKYSGRHIYQYNLKGDFITSYKSCAEAERQTGLNKELIRHCGTGNMAQLNGFLFTFGNDPTNYQLKKANHSFYNRKKYKSIQNKF